MKKILVLIMSVVLVFSVSCSSKENNTIKEDETKSNEHELVDEEEIEQEEQIDEDENSDATESSDFDVEEENEDDKLQKNIPEGWDEYVGNWSEFVMFDKEFHKDDSPTVKLGLGTPIYFDKKVIMFNKVFYNNDKFDADIFKVWNSDIKSNMKNYKKFLAKELDEKVYDFKATSENILIDKTEEVDINGVKCLKCTGFLTNADPGAKQISKWARADKSYLTFYVIPYTLDKKHVDSEGHESKNISSVIGVASSEKNSDELAQIMVKYFKYIED